MNEASIATNFRSWGVNPVNAAYQAYPTTSSILSAGFATNCLSCSGVACPGFFERNSDMQGGVEYSGQWTANANWI